MFCTRGDPCYNSVQYIASHFRPFMREVWLKTNHRAILFGCSLPVIFAAMGLWMAWTAPEHSATRWVGVGEVLVGTLTTLFLLRQLRRPRIARDDGNVLFYMRSGPPIAVPLEVVEAFFAGQGPAHLPVVANQPRTVNLVARLSRRYPEWAEQSVKVALGTWTDGYVTIRGSWCEPLDSETIRRLNRRLKEVKDET
jgi:hypothetical protein